jgi:hypothetical protein
MGDYNPDLTRAACNRFQVTFTSIEVSHIDDGTGGGDLEARWTFVVNGQVQHVAQEDLDMGVTNLGKTFFVEAPAETGSIVISVSGTEEDSFFDDDLPGFTHIWGADQNFGQGARQGSGSNGTITYQMNYIISCVQSTTTLMSRATLLAFAGQSRKVQGKSASEELLLSLSLRRLRGKGFDVISTTPAGDFILQGAGNLPTLIKRHLANAS